MRKTITQSVMGLKFKVKAGEFFQSNPHVLPSLIDHVCKQAVGPGDCRYLIDTYCGSGLFALSSAGQFETVYGVEISALAIASAKENAHINNITNTQFLQGLSTAIFQTVSHLNPAQTVVVIDPPRKGCDDKFLTQLFAFRPKRLVYVSCDPSTQARDAMAIVASGYKIVDITPFDLFPQTRHIENVISFTL
ncbi:class I SAM-dependent RNA methyltransferase [archaeon]|nr:MAG: class I SAM-dependent RNA methyltransferase [archaeon]